jgi:hypothetical protein
LLAFIEYIATSAACKRVSEAVRRVIDERLAVEAGLQALQNLRRLGGPDDVFGRAPTKKR